MTDLAKQLALGMPYARDTDMVLGSQTPDFMLPTCAASTLTAEPTPPPTPFFPYKQQVHGTSAVCTYSPFPSFLHAFLHSSSKLSPTRRHISPSSWNNHNWGRFTRTLSPWAHLVLALSNKRLGWSTAGVEESFYFRPQLFHWKVCSPSCWESRFVHACSRDSYL